MLCALRQRVEPGLSPQLACHSFDAMARGPSAAPFPLLSDFMPNNFAWRVFILENSASAHSSSLSGYVTIDHSLMLPSSHLQATELSSKLAPVKLSVLI